MMQIDEIMSSAMKTHLNGQADSSQKWNNSSEMNDEQSTGNVLNLEKCHIAAIFRKFKINYGNAWSSLYVDTQEMLDAVDTWYNKLKDFELFAVKRAYNRAIAKYKKFPPNLGEYEELCYPTREELGLLDDYSAYKAASHGDWSCDVIWNAVQEVGQYDIRNNAEAKRPFIAKYREFVDLRLRGLPLKHERPAHMRQLPAAMPDIIKHYMRAHPELNLDKMDANSGREYIRKMSKKLASA